MSNDDRASKGDRASVERLRALAMSFPGVVEGSHFEAIDFRVGKRIFLTCREPGIAVLRLSPDEQRELVASSTYCEPVPGSWGLKGWTRVRLDDIDDTELSELAEQAWRGVAPKRLRESFKSKGE